MSYAGIQKLSMYAVVIDIQSLRCAPVGVEGSVYNLKRCALGLYSLSPVTEALHL